MSCRYYVDTSVVGSKSKRGMVSEAGLVLKHYC